MTVHDETSHRATNHPGLSKCQACGGECVTITFTETRTYRATVHRSELGSAVLARGPENDGHDLPADLGTLTGEPWPHGDLAGFLSYLGDDPRYLADSDGMEVTSIKPAS